MKKPTDNARSTKTFQRLRAQYRAKCESLGAGCHLCGQPIDYSAPPRTSESFEVDHFFPVSTHPHLVNDMASWRPSHKRCNLSRGTKPVEPLLGRPSEDW